jgi:glycosyltransferase involved in cell wall biosynthesis
VSLFLVGSGREWRDDQRQILVVARELRKRSVLGYIVAEPGSDLLRKASDEGLATLAMRLRGRMGWLVRKSLTGAMRDHGCRLAHFHDTLGASLGLQAAAGAAVPIRILTRPADSSPLEGRLPFASIDAVIAGTDGVRSILVRGGIPEDRIEVVPPGVDFARFTDQPRGDGFLRKTLGLEEDEFLVGAVVPLEDEKGHEALLDAAALVAGQAPKVRFVVLGEGTLRLEAPGPDAARPMDNVLYYLGFRRDAPRILASLDMFTVFSHLDGLLGFLIEAMAAGLPVAGADVGSARDLVAHRDSGLLVPPRNARALADAVVKVHFDKNLAARLAARGRETVLEKYSQEAMARRIIGVYENRAHRKGLKLS